MAAATALDIAELPFSDLVVLLSPETPADDGRFRRVVEAVATELGRGGSGLLAVAGVPRVGALRRRLLPLARRLALMDHPIRSQLLKKHGLGSDVPLKKLNRSVSSFAQLLRHSGELTLLESVNNNNGFNSSDKIQDCNQSVDANGDDDMENLGGLVKELGLYMMELGILVARACDIAIGRGQLEQSITDFGTAKARLIHYHSELDNNVIRDNSTKRKGSVSKVAVKPYQSCSERRSESLCPCCIKSEDGTTVMSIKENDSKDASIQGQAAAEISLLNLWQEWHYDYGILTVLTAPLFLSASEDENSLVNLECHPPDGHTHLHLCNGRKIFSVRCSPENFIVQVGEAADILSQGKLKSTLHAVSRPLTSTDISRETFVVFLQPSWDKTLAYPGYSLDEGESILSKETSDVSDGSAGPCDEDTFMQEILKRIPPMSSRLKEGMTFAEFSRQTTKQYYGGSGIQQNN
ncbi:unnamed protein product [Miscanthus lutarioriparius]|uniref:Isopenicillin N synthase-like Fe(2+) 2OG dioxygenase domain-containing protein n=1 Tax=Miscanthus lutarioriparius TaxID=422564 RepID=A0A811QC88_9POAL|nr:unnamed protein product [Miscanthus lutarioriparius]